MRSVIVQQGQPEVGGAWAGSTCCSEKNLLAFNS